MSMSLLSPFIQFSNPFYCETRSGLSPAVNSVQSQKVTVWSQGPGLVVTRPWNWAKCVFDSQ